MKTLEDLEKEQDKMAIFTNKKLLLEYIKKMSEYVEAFSRMLDDKQKLEIVKTEYFKKFTTYWKYEAVQTIKDDSIKNEIAQDISIAENLFDHYSFGKFVLTLNDGGKMKVLKNSMLVKKFEIDSYDIEKIISNMSSENREKIISDKKLIEELELDRYTIKKIIIEQIDDDNVKLDISKIYEFEGYERIQILKSFSSENIINIILKEKLEKYDIIELINDLETNSKIDFIKNQKSFLEENDIEIYKIVQNMMEEQQLEFIGHVDELNLEESEKKKIYAVLSNETKHMLDIEQIDKKYRRFIEMELNEREKISINLNEDLDQYKDLDELIDARPLEIIKNDEDRKKFLELCEICPELIIEDNFEMFTSTAEEYIKGEKWIDSVLEEINPEWSDIQKAAYITTRIDKKLSYTPEFETEVESLTGERSLWKVIESGYGVCLGIAKVEEYILKRAGIECELVESHNHAFVKIKNIEIPTKEGIVKGDTLVDPTWDLGNYRYGAKPNFFCKSYDEIRKCDIDDEGKDHECHKVEDLEKTNLINMDEESLREVFKSIGIAGRDGYFPIGNLIEQVKKIDETSENIQTNINNKFKLLKSYCPEFATCQEETIKIVQDTLFKNNEKFKFDRCVASRVYDKNDLEKKAILYIYFKFEDKGEYFYYADKELGECVELTKEQFMEKFECYELDIKKTNGKKEWEIEDVEIKSENNSSHIANEGEER